jgi:hypothetical protein
MRSTVGRSFQFHAVLQLIVPGPLSRVKEYE